MFAWAVTMTFAATGTLPGVVSGAGSGPLGGPLGELVTACMAEDPALRPTARQVVDRLLGMGTHEVTRQGPLAGGPPPADLPTLAGQAFTAGTGSGSEPPSQDRGHRDRGGAGRRSRRGDRGLRRARRLAAPGGCSRTSAAKLRSGQPVETGAFTRRVVKPSRPARPPSRTPTRRRALGSGYSDRLAPSGRGGRLSALQRLQRRQLRRHDRREVHRQGGDERHAAGQDRRPSRDPGRYDFYAGPVRLPASNTCISWGGTIGRSPAWASGWTHCG